MRILLVAEDAEVISAFKTLVAWGQRVWVCNSLQEAKAKIGESAIELVLIDEEALRGNKAQIPGLLMKAEDAPIPWVGIGCATGDQVAILPGPPTRDDLRELIRKMTPRLEPAPLNHKAAMVICDEDEELLADIVEVFLRDAPKQIAKIQEAFRQDNLAQVSSSAHSIKGASGNLAGEPLYEAAQELEWASHRKDLSVSRTCFAQVQYQFVRLKHYLRRTGLAGG